MLEPKGKLLKFTPKAPEPIPVDDIMDVLKAEFDLAAIEQIKLELEAEDED